jgi:HD superfamily phosphodiesterase
MTEQAGDQAAMAALLAGLLVGAGRMMESVGAWADRLCGDNPTPLATCFINQLADEWPDALPPDAFCEQITEHVRRHLSVWHPGWPHLWAHVLRVTGAAVALAEDENADPTLAYLAAICHDVAKLDEFRTSIPHEEVGASFAGRILRGYLKPAQIDAIQAAILRQGDDTLADILRDADKLDKIGAAGVLRRVSTETRQSWLPSALWRVKDDWQRFPAMCFDWSTDLADSKGDFLVWFLPLARQVIGD